MRKDLRNSKSKTRPQVAEHDNKGLEICTAGLEFKSGRASLVRTWDNRSFTRSPGPTKYAFQGIEFPRIQKKYIATSSCLSIEK